MKQQVLILAFVIFIFLPLPLSAQLIYSFAQILNSAIATHPLISGKKYASQAAKSELDGAQWLQYPSFTVQASSEFDEKGSGVLRVEQPLWTGGRITSAIDGAEKRFAASGEAINEVKLELTLKVITAYTETIRQKGRLKHARVSIEEHQKLLNLILRRVKQEVSSLADQRLAESRLFQAMSQEAISSQSFNNGLAQLSQLSGEVISDIYELDSINSGLPEELDTILELVMAYSPVLRRINFEIGAANADISSKQSMYMPQLSLQFESTIGQAIDNRVMFVFEAAPGAGLSALSGVNSAIAQRQAIHMSKEAARRNIQEQVMLNWNEWTASKIRIASTMESRIRTTEVFESYKRQYVIGKKTWLDVLNSVRESAQAEYQYEDSKSEKVGSYLRLSAECGLLNKKIKD